MDRKTWQKISKETEDLNTIYQLDLTHIYKTLYPTTAKYTFFSRAHDTFSGIGHVLGYKTSPNKF